MKISLPRSRGRVGVGARHHGWPQHQGLTPSPFSPGILPFALRARLRRFEIRAGRMGAQSGEGRLAAIFTLITECSHTMAIQEIPDGAAKRASDKRTWTVCGFPNPVRVMECGSLLPLSLAGACFRFQARMLAHGGNWLPRQEASLLQGKAAASRRTPWGACAFGLRGGADDGDFGGPC